MIVLFDKAATNFSTNGLLVLDKYCRSAVISESLNGDYKLDIELTNADNTYTNQVKADMILRAPAPIRETPLVQNLSTYSIYKVTSNTPMRNKPSTSSGKTIRTAKKNWKLIKLSQYNASWYYMSTMSGKTGYVAASHLAYDSERASTAPGYQVIPEQSGDQLFRIVSVSHTLDGVQVAARHISYDLQGNFIRSLSLPNTSGATALDSTLHACMDAHEFEGYSDVTELQTIDATRKNPIDVFFADDGFRKYSADFLRDNYNIYLLRSIGRNRGASIAYRKNMTGMTLTVDAGAVITRIIPVGYDKKGKPIYLDSVYVDSPHIGDYARPRIKELDCKEVKVGSGYANTAAVKAKLLQLANAEFAKGVDLPTVSASLEFEDLDDAAIAALRTIYMGDEIAIKHDEYGYDLRADVIGYSWDSLLLKYEGVELGDRQIALGNLRIDRDLIPHSGIAAIHFSPGAVDATAVGDDVAYSLDMTDNESVASVAQQYVRNAWITGEQVFKYAAGASTPNPASITVSANLQNVLMDRWQYKDAGGSWVDYPTGDGNATNTATALVVKPGHAVWVGSVCTLRMLTDDANINDTFCLYKVSDGATGDTGATGAAGLHGLTAILSNAAHTLPKATDGTITYTGSGTILRLFEGAAELAYDGAGVNNGTWKVDTTASGITCGSLTDSGNYLTVGNHSAMAGNTASVTFAITGKRANGTAITLSITQTLSVAQQGATGTPAIVLTVYAPNGSVFTNQAGTLLLSAVGYSGANQITSGATYQWKKYTGGSWVTISGATASTLPVSGADVAGLQAYKCEMTYGGVVYSGTITLIDKTDNYQAAISSTGGDTFRNGIGTSAMVCRLWQNGAEADALKSEVISQTAPSSPVTGQMYYKITPSTPQVALMRWSGSAWVDVTTNPTFAHEKSYTWYRRDKDGNPLDSGAAFATGKVIFIDGDDVDLKTIFRCEVA